MDPQLQLRAARLRERMVAGLLPRERLQLGDALGDEAARTALGRGAPEPPGPWDPPTPPPTLERWGRSFGPFGPNVMLRVAVAIIRDLAGRIELPALAPAVGAVDAFLAQADAAGAGKASGLVEECEAAAKGVARAALGLEGQDLPHRACLATLPLLRAVIQILVDGAPERSLFDEHYLRVLQHAALATDDLERVQALVRREVCGWALAER